MQVATLLAEMVQAGQLERSQLSRLADALVGSLMTLPCEAACAQRLGQLRLFVERILEQRSLAGLFRFVPAQTNDCICAAPETVWLTGASRGQAKPKRLVDSCSCSAEARLVVDQVLLAPRRCSDELT